LHDPVGVLALEDAKRVEQLLQEFMRISLQLKQQGRSLSTLVSHAAVLRFACRAALRHGVWGCAGCLVPCCVGWCQVGGWGGSPPHALESLCHLSHARHPQPSSEDCIT
jgi:hypothetical protein